MLAYQFSGTTATSHMAAAAGGVAAAENAAGPQLSSIDVPQKHSGGSRHTKAARVETKQPTKVEGKQPAKAKGPTSAHRYISVHWPPCCSRFLGIFMANLRGQFAVENATRLQTALYWRSVLHGMPDTAQSYLQHLDGICKLGKTRKRVTEFLDA